MGRNFYIADTHFGHSNIIKFDGRPFNDSKEMDEQLIKNWNNTVTNEDTVYILGDFCWGTQNSWVDILSKLNGHKILIKGNHDLRKYPAEVKKYFDDIKDRLEIKDNGKTIIMDHYPIMCYRHSYDKNVWMLHGHVHGAMEQAHTMVWVKSLVRNCKRPADNRGQIMNVGCMMPYMNYTPHLAVFPLEDCFSTREEAEQALREDKKGDIQE